MSDRGRASGRAADRARSRDLRQLRRLAAYLRPYMGKLVASLLALTVAAGSVLSIGIGLRHLVDGGFGAGRASAMDHGLEAMLLVVAVLAIATYFRSYLVTWLGERVVSDLRRDLYAHVVRLSPGFFEVTRTGEVISRLSTDTAVIQTVMGSSVTQAMRNLLLLVGGIGLLLVTNPKLTGLVLLVIPLVILPLVLIGRRVRGRARLAQDRLADVGAMTEETLNAVRTVQGFAQEDRESRRLAGLTDEAFTAAVHRARARSAMGAAVVALAFGAIVVVLWIGGRDVLEGRLSPGELASFIFYAAVVAGAVGGLSDIVGDLQSAAGASERLFELLDTQPTIAAPLHPTPLPVPGSGHLLFEQVSFAYPSHPDRLVLKELDLEVRPGETVALVGPSGAGKSSVLQLALRFYDPVAGRITLDGVDLRELAPQALRARLGLVPQEPVLFSGDAWTNIGYGRPEAGREAVRAAADAAQASEFLDRLPDGFATFLGEKGVRLSGGQRQRIAIARAILREPELLLLDEATSALDAENERLVQVAVERLRQGRSCLVIAHRLATVRAASRIVVMEDGRVVDSGRHEDLVRREGLYARLATLQFTMDRAA